jgi:hypothetical protein
VLRTCDDCYHVPRRRVKKPVTYVVVENTTYYCLRRYEFVTAVTKKVISCRMWCAFGKHVTIIFHPEEEGSLLLCNFATFLQRNVASHAVRFKLSAYVAEGTVPEIKYRS